MRRCQPPHVPILLFLAIALPVAFARSLAADVATTADGRRVAGRLTGTSAATLIFRNDAPPADLPFAKVGRIDFDRDSCTIVTNGPFRRFLLWGGESIGGELLRFTPEQVELRLRTGQTVEVPTSALAGIENPAGEIDALYDDFEQDSRLWEIDAGKFTLAPQEDGRGRALAFPGTSATSVRRRLPAILPQARVEFDLLDSHPADGDHFEAILEFSDTSSSSAASGPSDHIVLVIVDGRYRMTGTGRLPSLTVRPLPRSSGWHRFTLLSHTNGILGMIDGKVLATGPATDLGLTGIRFRHRPRSSPAARSSRAAEVAAVDSLLIRRLTPSEVRPPLPGDRRDVVLGTDGDDLYGDVTAVDSHRIHLRGAFGDTSIPWTEASGLGRRVGGNVAPAAPVDGWIARIELRQPADRPGTSPDRLVVALRSAGDESLDAVHPYVGPLSIRWEHIDRIEPLYRGTLQLIEPGFHHLGNEVRASFQRPHPEGNRLEREFILATLPEHDHFVSAEVHDMEASGPAAPPGSPFLADLRAGFLATDLRINGKHIGDFNSRLTYRDSPGGAQRVRVPLPPGILRTGRNVFVIEQQPSRHDPRQFDDCEIGRIAVEW